MATLVLTGIGTLVGGPIGGAIGALAGQAIDRRVLFKPKGREGPRLDDLRIQTSRYGTPIPAVHGRMRVAGTVVWATDLIERRDRQGGGKGRPSTTTYAYSASFAVLLSARPALRVERIWADGNLLRGAGGDWKQPATMRFHDGRRDAPPDPLIAAAEGPGNAPAMRGMAHVVFDELDLTPFGNRIPAMTFELVADEGGCAIADIVAVASGGAARAETDARLDGFATGGDSVRALIDALAPVARLRAIEDHAVVRLVADGGSVAMLDADELAEVEERLGGGGAPDEVALAYLDPARDHQAGLQRARRVGGGARTLEVDLPAALSAEAAKAAAAALLEDGDEARRRLTARLPFRRMGLRAGERVTLATRPGVWRIAERVIEADAVRVELVLERAVALPARAATPGRAIGERDEPVGGTRLILVDLPALGETPATAPNMVVAAAGSARGWRRAALVASHDDGRMFEPLGATAAAAVMGVAATRLAPASAYVIDEANMVDVVLLHEAMTIAEADVATMFAGGSLVLAGDELIGFCNAERLDGTRWRLSRLLRGVRGTEAAMATHEAGERILIVTADTLRDIGAPASAIGRQAVVVAAGAGDPLAGVSARAPILGAALRPPSPVHGRRSRAADGALVLSWTRRSRAGWRWSDHGDAPLGELRERYRVTLVSGDGGERVLESDVPTIRLPPPDGEGARRALVAQIGDHGLSPALVINMGE